MEYLVDKYGKQLKKNDVVKIVDRVKTHEGKHLNLIGRSGIILDSTPRGYVFISLYKKYNVNELCDPAYFYPEELEILISSEGDMLAHQARNDQTDESDSNSFEEEPEVNIYKVSETADWKITKEQYKRLISYVGCGNFPDADIIFFGNEEGTGSFSIESNVEARFNSFGKQDDETNYKHFFGESYTSGYWEPSALGGRDKIVEYLQRRGQNPKVNNSVRSSFVKSIAQIVLALENQKSRPIADWFQKNPSPSMKQEIQSFGLSGLFCPREGIQTALTDWRHLPRPNEGAWYDEYNVSDTISKLYLQAYNQFKSGLKDEFSDYSEDVENRKKIVRRAIEESSAQVLIGLGGANGFKKNVLSHMFNVDFSPIELEEGIQIYKATASLEKRNIEIFLLPFPSAQVYGSYAKLQASLNTFVSNHLSPLLNG